MADLDEILKAVQTNAGSLPGQIQMLDENLRQLKRELQALSASAAPNSGIWDVKEALDQLNQDFAARLRELEAAAAAGNRNPAPGFQRSSTRIVQAEKILANTDKVIAEPSKVAPSDSKIGESAKRILQQPGSRKEGSNLSSKLGDLIRKRKKR